MRTPTSTPTHTHTQAHIPDLTSTKQDPLAGLGVGGGDEDGAGDGDGVAAQSGEGGGSNWSSYYEAADLRAEIQRDLDRLVLGVGVG